MKILVRINIETFSGLENIGFLLVKNTYQDSYLYITLVFNDIDTYLSKIGLIIDYSTAQGIIKHFYDYLIALRGIVSITCRDFKTIHGFPNYWGWGFEDNMLNQQVLSANLVIDRTQFYRIDVKRITRLNTSPLRTVNRIEFNRFVQRNKEGIYSIHHLSYTIKYTRSESSIIYSHCFFLNQIIHCIFPYISYFTCYILFGSYLKYLTFLFFFVFNSTNIYRICF